MIFDHVGVTVFFSTIIIILLYPTAGSLTTIILNYYSRKNCDHLILFDSNQTNIKKNIYLFV